MELRKRCKLLKRGKFSADVVMPRWWLVLNGLSAGDTVLLTITPDKVVVEPSSAELFKEERLAYDQH